MVRASFWGEMRGGYTFLLGVKLQEAREPEPEPETVIHMNRNRYEPEPV